MAKITPRTLSGFMELLHAVTGLKHREIAALLELPLPTVLSKYHRAIRKMRADLEGDNAHDK